MNIRPAAPADIPQLIEVMSRSFSSDPAYQHVFPDPARRERFFRPYMVFRLRYCMARGSLFMTEDGLGLVGCIPPDTHMSLKDLLAFGALKILPTVNPIELGRLLVLMDSVSKGEARHAPAAPYWSIAPICVDPAAQGRGYGTALMNYSLRQVIPAGAPCFLETQSRKNKDYYRRFGFTALGEERIGCGAVSNITMLRPAL